MTTFLSSADMRELTGYCHKGKQIAQLRRMGIPFFTNAAGKPIVALATVEGRKERAAANEKTWEPAWAANHR